MKVKNAKELGTAVHNEEPTIEIEGDLAKKTFKIKATGKIAWCVCIGAIGVAIIATVAAAIPDPAEPAEIAAAGISYGFAAVTLGTAATTAGAIGIAGAIAAGATGTAFISAAKATLNSLRNYEIAEKTDNKLVLKRKTKKIKKS